MDPKFLKQLDESYDVHEMLPIDHTKTNTYRLLQKEVRKSRLVDDMTSLDHWTTLTPYIDISLSNTVLFNGHTTLKMTCPTNLPDWLPNAARGRIYAEPGALRVMDREDLTEWNRISVWIYPDIHGMKSITLRLQLRNDGELKSPDRFGRVGHHNFALKTHEWNHITLEMPMLPRDAVTGIGIEYDMCGHEPDSDDTLTWYISDLELQKVNADNEEGWTPADGKIIVSGGGYTPDAPKKAILPPALTRDIPMFRVLKADTDEEVLNGRLEHIVLGDEVLNTADFSEIREEGQYYIETERCKSPVFRVAADTWEPSCWKVINFFLSQRCGCYVRGKHMACHTDLLVHHGNLKLSGNGGWHDAADLAQGMSNTADATAAFFLLCDRLKGKNPRLYRRAMEEALWGLQYVVKTQFGDGFRADYSSSSIWTDGIIGSYDDIISEAMEIPYNNLVCAFAEALGAYSLRGYDDNMADYALKLAAQDYDHAMGMMERIKNGDTSARRELFEIKIFGPAAAAAAALVRAGRTEYTQYAVDFAARIMECQQQDTPDWKIPIRGFFYVDRAHTLPWHHAHHSFEEYEALSMELLLEVLPDHEEAPKWRRCAELSAEYYKTIAGFGAPYGILPEGIYFADEAEREPELTFESTIWADETCLPGFRPQVENGICLDPEKQVYLRIFPVWYSFRGNTNVQLTEAVCAASAARVTGDKELYDIAVSQLEWVTGKNPFGQSLLYGEGPEWTDEYTVQPGTTIGQLPVGMQTYMDHDKPWWPQVATATYKEVWIATADKWIFMMSYVL